MLCLRLQLYSYVFCCSLASCVSPRLYLTLLSGTQGTGTGDGLLGGDVLSSPWARRSWQWLSGSLLYLLQSSSAQFCNIFSSEDSVQFSQHEKKGSEKMFTSLNACVYFPNANTISYLLTFARSYTHLFNLLFLLYHWLFIKAKINRKL